MIVQQASAFRISQKHQRLLSSSVLQGLSLSDADSPNLARPTCQEAPEFACGIRRYHRTVGIEEILLVQTGPPTCFALECPSNTSVSVRQADLLLQTSSWKGSVSSGLSRPAKLSVYVRTIQIHISKVPTFVKYNTEP